jgi:hypothetical protein
MSQVAHVVAWFSFFGLVLLLRLLTTRVALRILGPYFRRLADWAVERLNRPEEVDPEVEELHLIRRRQQLEGHIDRLRRILATDEGMSATRQLGNRLAYASLLDELKRTPILLPMPTSTRSISTHTTGGRTSSVEILEVGGWR